MLKQYGEKDYEILDRYLETAFQLLEGFADVDEARITLENYIRFHRRRDLPPRMEVLLRKLFLEKCRK